MSFRGVAHILEEGAFPGQALGDVGHSTGCGVVLVAVLKSGGGWVFLFFNYVYMR